jgi:hypothetical protein
VEWNCLAKRMPWVSMNHVDIAAVSAVVEGWFIAGISLATAQTECQQASMHSAALMISNAGTLRTSGRHVPHGKACLLHGMSAA